MCLPVYCNYMRQRKPIRNKLMLAAIAMGEKTTDPDLSLRKISEELGIQPSTAVQIKQRNIETYDHYKKILDV